MNKTMNNKMNKTEKTKNLADYQIWMYQSLWLKIISKVKPRNWWTENSREKKSTNFCFILLNKNIEMTYLKIPRQWSLQAKKCLSVLINQLFASVLPLLT